MIVFFVISSLLFQDTRIGMSVNGIRKHCRDEDVVSLAKILIKNWKRLLGDYGIMAHCLFHVYRCSNICRIIITSVQNPAIPRRLKDQMSWKMGVGPVHNHLVDLLWRQSQGKFSINAVNLHSLSESETIQHVYCRLSWTETKKKKKMDTH